MLNDPDTSRTEALQAKTSIGPEQADTFETFTPNWAPDAPRGGRAVLTRILKELATVPLFLAQTFVQSLRDVGYNTTTSALEEHVDNAIEAGATEVRVFFHQTGRRGNFETNVMVDTPPPLSKSELRMPNTRNLNTTPISRAEKTSKIYRSADLEM